MGVMIGEEKEPFPLLRYTTTCFCALSVTAMSGFPSPLKSPTARPVRCWKLVFISWRGLNLRGEARPGTAKRAKKRRALGSRIGWQRIIQYETGPPLSNPHETSPIHYVLGY